jgi:hypothetical protein
VTDDDTAGDDRYSRALAAALGAVGGAAVGGPAGAIAGAALGVAFEPFAAHIFEELGLDGKRRAGRVLGTAFEAVGRSEEEFERLIGASERARLITGIAMSSATKTAWEDKVKTLGRSLASGLLAEDDATVDIEQLILAAIADIEGPHLALLDLLVNFQPPTSWGDPPAVAVRNPRRREFNVAQIKYARPRLAPVLQGLTGTLERHGLIMRNDQLQKAFTDYTREVGSWIERQARLMTNKNGMRKTIRAELSTTKAKDLAGQASWSPTDLGEHVIARFREAGAAVPDSWGEQTTPEESKPPGS